MTSFKVTVSCAIGAVIGTVVSLEFAPHLWFLGLLCGLISGFLAGYLAYDPMKVIRAIPGAFRVAGKDIAGPFVHFWKYKTVTFWGFGATLLTAFWVCAIGVSWFTPHNFFASMYIVGKFMTYDIFFSHTLREEDIALARIGLVVAYFIGAQVTLSRENQPKGWNPSGSGSKSFVKHLNPISAMYYIPKLLIELLVEAVKFIYRFAVELFLNIHSDIRLLCGVDAALGATAGYFAGSVLVGMLAGAILGLLNYEILSKRVLKLVPTHH
ncbi:hypothetical protein HN859_02625 [Candidatus Parcubacteria bacterium]|nr:hypothetical protein [Candidatus Parcubacteria bacterium]